MTGVRTFCMDDVLAVYIGRMLPSTGDESNTRERLTSLFRVVSHLSGRPVTTRGFRMMLDPAAEELRKQHPFLLELDPPVPVDEDNPGPSYNDELMAWVRSVEQGHGVRVDVRSNPEAFSHVTLADEMDLGLPGFIVLAADGGS